mmetsp:Transcript_99922/g.282824  ORF Transcript_99922/g.282824 Transcript_99922/m.282824 type:complete len:224 (+) Transcript_99922:686-1357(+)
MGAPCSPGSASPFISYARRTSPKGLSAFSMGMLACIPSTPSKTTCRMPWHSTPSRLRPAQCSSTSRRYTPPHRAVEMAPQPHGMPLVFSTLSSSLRRLPPHCIVEVTSRLRNRVFRSSSVSDTLFAPSPSTRSLNCAGSMTGTGWWCRMNHTGFGVTHASIMSSMGSSALQGLLLWKMSPGWRSLGSAPYGSSPGSTGTGSARSPIRIASSCFMAVPRFSCCW